VEGRSLQAMLDGRQLFPLPRVMRLMEQVCSHSIAHSATRPPESSLQNLMLTADRHGQDTDFGRQNPPVGTAQTRSNGNSIIHVAEQVKASRWTDARYFFAGVILLRIDDREKPFPRAEYYDGHLQNHQTKTDSRARLTPSIHPDSPSYYARSGEGANGAIPKCQELLTP